MSPLCVFVLLSWQVWFGVLKYKDNGSQKGEKWKKIRGLLRIFQNHIPNSNHGLNISELLIINQNNILWWSLWNHCKANVVAEWRGGSRRGESNSYSHKARTGLSNGGKLISYHCIVSRVSASPWLYFSESFALVYLGWRGDQWKGEIHSQLPMELEQIFPMVSKTLSNST